MRCSVNRTCGLLVCARCCSGRGQARLPAPGPTSCWREEDLSVRGTEQWQLIADRSGHPCPRTSLFSKMLYFQTATPPRTRGRRWGARADTGRLAFAVRGSPASGTMSRRRQAGRGSQVRSLSAPRVCLQRTGSEISGSASRTGETLHGLLLTVESRK